MPPISAVPVHFHVPAIALIASAISCGGFGISGGLAASGGGAGFVAAGAGAGFGHLLFL